MSSKNGDLEHWFSVALHWFSLAVSLWLRYTSQYVLWLKCFKWIVVYTIWLKANFSRSRVQEARDGFSFHALLTCSEILQESIWLLLANNGNFCTPQTPLLVEEALSKTSDPDMDRFRGALDIFFYTFIVIV